MKIHSAEYAPADCLGSSLPEALLDHGQDGLAAAVLGRVVEQAGDGLNLIPPSLDDEGGNTQQLGDVGDIAALADMGGLPGGSRSPA